VKEVTAKREWPDWRPPAGHAAAPPRSADLHGGRPRKTARRARRCISAPSSTAFNGSNEPLDDRHGGVVGCIRMRNEDVIDLYERVKFGSRVS